MNTQKKMYKVISPIEKKGGGTYWMRVGTGFTNRDDSINVYLDAMPAPNSASHRFELQIRELTEEDLRKREAFAANGGNGGNGGNSGSSGGAAGGFATGSGSYGRDLGGIGGGPNTRAVTANAGSDEVPF